MEKPARHTKFFVIPAKLESSPAAGGIQSSGTLVFRTAAFAGVTAWANGILLKSTPLTRWLLCLE
jgi:hypothetical protein